MSRTKLDEIVEVENGGRIQRTCEERTAVCKRIAEKAFRHGVEQAREKTYPCRDETGRAYVSFGNIEPAPAERRSCSDRRKP